MNEFLCYLTMFFSIFNGSNEYIEGNYSGCAGWTVAFLSQITILNYIYVG